MIQIIMIVIDNDCQLFERPRVLQILFLTTVQGRGFCLISDSNPRIRETVALLGDIILRVGHRTLFIIFCNALQLSAESF
jgi:hypothetical protein